MTRIGTARSVVSALLAALLLTSPAPAQRAPVNGMRPADLRAHALVGATVVIRPGEEIESATILIRDGVIEAVGPDVEIPGDARVWPVEGLTVYPGLIDASVLVSPDERAESPGRHWNTLVHPEIVMAEQPLPDDGLRKTLRSLGFTAAALYPKQGILRGTGSVVALAESPEHVRTYLPRAAMAAGFDRAGSWSKPATPGSLMGVIAIMRQVLLDAKWHAAAMRVYIEHPDRNEPPAPADALVALRPVVDAEQAVLFDAGDELNLIRAARIAEEFGLRAMMLGSGYEFRRLDEVAALHVPVIVPVRFPSRPDVSTIDQADHTSLREMMAWEQAPTNVRRLLGRGVTVAITTERLESRDELPSAMRRAYRHGLEEGDALAALTVTPARLLGLDHVMGTIEPGKLANLVVVDGRLFAKKAEVRDTWINGRRHEINPAPDALVAMTGTLRTGDGHTVRVDLDTGKPSAVFHLPDESKTNARKITVIREQVSIVVDGRPFDVDGYVRLRGAIVDGGVIGVGALPDGQRFDFRIDRVDAAPADGAEEAVAAAEGAVETPAIHDHVTGAWSIVLSSPEMSRDVPVTLDLELEDEGGLTGSARLFGREFEVLSGSYDGATQAIDLEVEGPRGEPRRYRGVIVGQAISGTMTGPRGEASFEGTRSAATADADDVDEFEMPPDMLAMPLGAYGLTEPPTPRNVMITGATIWTSGPDGVIEDGTLVVVDGRIAAVGRDLTWDGPALERIDAAGKHVTPGLIDCHSHTGVSGGVNEFPEANTAEVRIGDVVNPDDINWYRQLAGGLTAANQLHGSANPIGGQNSVVKLKWGGPVQSLPVSGARPGIKFALGENVKRSPNRYPNTRMGVETFIRDAFTAAREYEAAWARYRALPDGQRAATMPPRRDLELDALVEILAGDRLVHCHSYRQDEILMLIRVADDFGFTIGTFQHVLEGYKVAESIAAHGAGASSFSDWWAYKVEVMDAIPHNGTLMTDVGVLVSFNSDSSELARRMNTEASKAVRYGGLDPHEALKLVTINPARQLAIGDRTGSLEVGKDADFVVWSGDPLSTYSMCEQTWIEGTRYFDLETDRDLRAAVSAERRRLSQKILALAHGELPEREGDAAPVRPAAEFADLDDEARAWMEEQVRLGVDPLEARPGDCGCGVLWELSHGHQ